MRRSLTSLPLASMKHVASRPFPMRICKRLVTAISRWGATGKVRQIDKLYPQLREDEPASGLTRTIAASVEQLDLATVIKVSQAVSGEIALEKLIDKLMRAARGAVFQFTLPSVRRRLMNSAIR